MPVREKKQEETINVLEHELVPKHILLTKDEAQKILKTYRINVHQLPRIKASDPAVKVIGAKPGDIVKIIRRSETAGEAEYYRYVIEEA